MKMSLIFLKLFLDELGISSRVDTFQERKTIQKAVYLGQWTGVDLNHRFGWYLKGPYSPSLAEAYYHLADELTANDKTPEKYQLKKPLRDKLKKIQPLLKVPKNIQLPKEEWLELVASCHFLRHVSKLTDGRADEILKEEKPHLYEHRKFAKEKLQEVFPQ